MWAGGIYHVTFRGNARQAIFRDDRDRERLTERAAAAELGLCSGSAVSYLVRRIKAQYRADPALAEWVRTVTGSETETTR